MDIDADSMDKQDFGTDLLHGRIGRYVFGTAGSGFFWDFSGSAVRHGISAHISAGSATFGA